MKLPELRESWAEVKARAIRYAEEHYSVVEPEGRERRLFEILHELNQPLHRPPAFLAVIYLNHAVTTYRRFNNMASSKASEVKYISREVTDAQKEQFRAYASADGEELWKAFPAMMDEGYRFSFSYDKDNDVYRVTAYAPASGVNKGLALSASAGGWDVAIQFLMFKHMMLYEGKWQEPKGKKTENDKLK
jgi:hypothetical protein